MAHYLEDKTVRFTASNYSPKPINIDVSTKIQENNKPSFCIDALLARNEERANSPETPRSMSPTSSHSQSPPISPGSEEIQPNPFVPRPGLLNQIYPSATSTIYGYQTQPHIPTSAFHSLDGAGMVQKVQIPVNHNHQQLHHMQLEWLARTGIFYPRLPDLTAPYITKCPLPDPNANNCILNSANYALPYLLEGDPNLGLPNFHTIYFNDDILELDSNSKIKLTGSIQPSTDTYLSVVSVNFENRNWVLDASGISLTSDFTFILSIEDDNDETLQAKGQITVNQDNWKIHYTSNYITKKINNQDHMQIDWNWAYITDDTFEANYIGITTLDNQPLTKAESIKVKKALRNFERVLQWRLAEFGKDGITLIFNTILKLVPENEIFIPAPDPCAGNKKSEYVWKS